MRKTIGLIIITSFSIMLTGCPEDARPMVDFIYWKTDATPGSAKVYYNSTEDGVLNEFMSPCSSPTGITVIYNSEGEYVWVADYTNANLIAINSNTGAVLATIPSPHPHPIGIKADHDYPNQNIWVVTEADPPSNKAHLTLISFSDGTILKEIELPEQNPVGLGGGFDYLYLMYANSPVMHFLDYVTGEEVLIQNTGICNMRAGDRQGQTGTIWILDGDNNTLVEIDDNTGEHLHTITTPGACMGFEIE